MVTLWCLHFLKTISKCSKCCLNSVDAMEISSTYTTANYNTSGPRTISKHIWNSATEVINPNDNTLYL